MPRLILAGAAILLAGFVGAQRSGEPPGEWPTYSIAEAPASLRPAIRQADVIIVSLQHALLSELERELEKGGPAGAMRACHLDTTFAAFRTARQEGIAAGRTSDRLRNPLNAPPSWAAPIVKAHTGRRGAGVDGFAVDLGDRVGVLRPIVHTRTCEPCHGAADKIGAGVRAVLDDRYPQDRGVGFSVGEIRGWFWVEAPRTRPAPMR